MSGVEVFRGIRLVRVFCVRSVPFFALFGLLGLLLGSFTLLCQEFSD